MKYCQNCGTEIMQGAQVCTGCGILLDSNNNTSNHSKIPLSTYLIITNLLLIAIGLSLLIGGIILGQTIVEPLNEIDLFPIVFDTMRVSWSVIVFAFSSIISLVNIFIVFNDTELTKDYRYYVVLIGLINIIFIINAYQAFQFTI